MQEIVEGILSCSPYVGDFWYLTGQKVKQTIVPIDYIDIPFEKFANKKVRITIEEIK